MYHKLVERYCDENDIVIVKFFKTPRGLAWINRREIAIPYPDSLLNLYISFHEIGHIVTEIPNSEPSWLHEYNATKWALDELKSIGIDIGEDVVRAAKGYLKYQIKKALRKRSNIEFIPNSVFRYVGLNKVYCRQRIAEGKKMVVLESVSRFIEWKNIKIRWIINKKLCVY